MDPRIAERLAVIPLADTPEGLWTILHDLAGELGFGRVQMDFGDSSEVIDPPRLFTNYPRWFHADFYPSQSIRDVDLVEDNVLSGGGSMFYGRSFDWDAAETDRQRCLLGTLDDIGIRSAVSVPVQGTSPDLEGCVNFGMHGGRDDFLQQVEPILADLTVFATRLHLRGQRLLAGNGASGPVAAEARLSSEVAALRRHAQRLDSRCRSAERLIRSLEQMSRTDPLTGVANRRQLETLMAGELERVHRHGRPCTVAVLDIDCFKAINDTSGHGAGDRVLQGVASRVVRRLRATDHFGRWGGDEFVLVLPETTIENGVAMADRLRCAIADGSFGVARQVTVSIGVTQARRRDTITGLLNRADRALYGAKRAGRNRIGATRIKKAAARTADRTVGPRTQIGGA